MRREQVFWGWGEPGAGPSLPEHAVPYLRESLGIDGAVVSRPVPLEAVRLREPALDGAVRARLEAIVGAAFVRSDREARVLRCRGKSYLDLLAQRAGACEDAPDAVVAPGSHDEVAAVLAVCAEAGVAVVPFGGGTSVVGGLEPLRGRFPALASLDLRRMDGVLDVDERSLIATLGPGLRLPEADRALAARGLTLGHLPQSYEWATVGGCVATRSSGQASTGLGRIDANLVGVRLVAPAGELAARPLPASAAGPDLRQLVAGSEGTLGVITAATLRVHPLRAARRYEGWVVAGFEAGCEALRALEQAGAAPDIARLFDEDETRTALAFAGSGRVARAAVRARAGGDACLMIFGWGDRGRRAEAARRLRAAGARSLGQRPGRAWAASRFAGPHLRDDLLDRGVMVETLETAGPWSRLAGIHAAVRAALPGMLVGCHVSHLYPTGASLYFTVFARADDADPAGQWRAAKAAATDALLAAGGTLTHHHAVGRDHAPWMDAEVGPLGLDLLRAVKDRCDPAGIMNPGKILAPPSTAAG
ncbi:MAG TPA: FAD-binding oxidoreductase [Solirubrobacteraceae bacterium]|nr:FAD-binding oxidoreductase [Solirubrobacteraceae bacterium]